MTADSHQHHHHLHKTKSGSSHHANNAASISDTADHAYPHGHLGNLTPEQESAFVSFKNVIEEKGLCATQGSVPSHKDEDLLRYLRARRWNVNDAVTQFAETVTWRKANDLDVLYRTIDLEAYEQSRRLYPQWTGRRDRRGIPLYVFDIKTLDAKTVHNYEKDGQSTTFSKARFSDKTAPGLMRLFALYENLTKFGMPFCTQLRDREYSESPITIGTNIVDVSNVGLKQFWNLKAHMQAASQLATAHYPETLDRIYIIGAPFFFPTVWGWIKKWFDPITVSKIFILSEKEVTPTLTKFIDAKNLPKQYGGDLDWKFGDQPTVDPAWEGVIEWAPGHSSFISSPCIWQETEDGTRLECIGLGSVDGKERHEKICSIPKTWPSHAHANANGTAASATAVLNGNGVAQQEVPRTGSQQVEMNGSDQASHNNVSDHEAEYVTSGQALKTMVIGGDLPVEKEQNGEVVRTTEHVPAPLPTTIA